MSRVMGAKAYAISGLMAIFITNSALAESVTFQDMGRLLPLESLPEVTIYTAKEIVTLGPQKTEATAVAVVGDRILAVGNLDDLKTAAADQPFVVDHTFDNKVIVPGFISQHLHPFLSALTMESEIISIEDWVLPSGTVPGVYDRKEYLNRLQKADKKLKNPDEILVTWGFHHYFHGKLTLKDLDKINAKRPIIVWHRSCHEFIINSAAMKKYGVTKEYFAKQSESAQQQSNLAEGHFWEQGIFAVLPLLAAAIASPERLHAGLEFTETYLHTNGVTLGSEPGGIVSRKLQEAQNAVFSDSETPFRFYYIPDGKTYAQLYPDGNMIHETEKMLEWGEGYTSFLPKQVKLFADGAIYSQAMQMKDGYLDNHHGEWMMDLDVFARAFQEYWDAGYQIVIHQNGDAGLEMVLTNVEANMRRNPRYDHRTTIVHFGFSTKDQVKRIKALGCLVSANPYYVIALADNYSKNGIGPERANEMVRLGDVERAGIPFSLHSDMPMAPANPLFLMHCAVNRRTGSGRVAGPEQRVSVENALRAVTIEAAFSLRLENEVGSIEPGKLANFTILEKNPLKVDPKKIKDIKVWGTVHEGIIFPVMNRHEPKKVGLMVPKNDPAHLEIAETIKIDVGHDDHVGCSCSLSRSFAKVVFQESH